MEGVAVNTDFFHPMDIRKEKKTFALLEHCDEKMEDAIEEQNVARMHKYFERRENIADTLVSSNMQLIFDVAEDYDVHGANWGGMLSAGNIGLIHCVDNYYLTHQKIRFKVYAIRKIRKAMLAYLIKKQNSINLDAICIKFLFRVEAFIEKYKNNTKSFPTNFEIKTYLDLSDEEKREIQKNGDIDIVQYFLNPAFDTKKLIIEKHLYDIVAETILKLDKKLIILVMEYLGLTAKKRHTLEQLSTKYNLPQNTISSILEKITTEIKIQIKQNISIK